MGKTESLMEEIFSKGRKALALLVDPDKPLNSEEIERWDEVVDLWLVGGSLIANGDVAETVRVIKAHSNKPVVLFPGPGMPIVKADAILFMSLISGRNPELLIGQQVINAPIVRKLGLEVLPTAYLIVGNRYTAAHYMSFTSPIPEKKELVEATALAGLYLGFRYFYLDGGSGGNPISPEVIKVVAETTRRPVFVGGGITTADQCIRAWNSGATFVVIGTAVENGILKPDELWSVIQDWKQ
ncbi:MAG: geranylgeranylglyceryl/heptaprenylglyceryl phosphate synthase [Chlorobi bacterium]|nr:geranylgeranylglyceryl/heptaprenylglyceryl phosphate synthase [Chlorobiota bacterium]